MKHDKPLRKHVHKLLESEDAHTGVDSAVKNVPPKKRGIVPKGGEHSIWQLVEHLRIAQEDILDFCLNPKYTHRKWPEEYWPKSPAPPSAKAWNASLAAIKRDRERLQRIANDPKIDLFAEIPHGAGQTYLRELLLAADHNAYHTGQIVTTRRLLGIWK